MPIQEIKIIIKQAQEEGKGDRADRILSFSRDTRQWTSNDGGIYPGEIKLLNNIDKARQNNPV